MNLPMSWLNDYMDIDVTPKEYSDRLTMTGSKVEGWENMGESVQNVVAGKVLTCEDHPDSDHLHVCTVDAGTGEILQIVCGAPNVKAGIIVPVALVGAVLPDGKIKKGKLRGVESYGMLCSHDELGITEDMLGYEPEYGILILPDDIKIGTDIKDIFGMNETVVEFEITSNRPDCFSIIGLARETAASFNKKFTIPEVKFNENSENMRIIAATNENLQEAVREGRFRSDLYYRLHEAVIEIPRLRDCKEDIMPLANFFLKLYDRHTDKEIKCISKEAQRALVSHTWPGNVRELKSCIMRAMLLCENEIIDVEDLQLSQSALTEEALDFDEQERKINRERILWALKQCNGIKRDAAKMLEMSHTTFYARMKEYGIPTNKL